MDATVQDDYGQRFAAMLGADHAFGFWKGRVAWYAILRALGVGADDEVILPGYTCVMDVNPIMYVGARPVYADIEPVTYNLDPGLLEGLITPRTRAIVAQHTYGYPAALDPILTIAKKHGVPVVEDCCLALGARYRGRPVHSREHQMTIFRKNPVVRTAEEVRNSPPIYSSRKPKQSTATAMTIHQLSM